MLRVECGRALRDRAGGLARLAGERVVPPDVAAFLHRRVALLAADASENEDLLDRRRLLERLVGHSLERDDVAATPGAVLREQHFRAAIVDAVAEGVSAEASEDHRVGRAEPRAGEHRDGRLGHHAHVDRDAVAGLHAEVGERRREANDLAMELPVGERPDVAGLALPDDRRLRAVLGREVTVEAALGQVERRADEELRLRQRPLAEGRPRSPEDEVVRLLAPELVRLVERPAVHRRVLRVRCDARTLGELLGRLETAIFLQARFDAVAHGPPARSDELGLGPDQRGGRPDPSAGVGVRPAVDSP